MFGDGLGFVPDTVREGPEVCVIGQNPGADEERGQRVVGYAGREPLYEPHYPAPLIGKTGYEMERVYLPAAGLTRDDVNLCNLLKCRTIVNGRRTNLMPKGETLEIARRHCTEAHLCIPESTRLIVAMGSYAADFFGCPGTISEWRGFLTPPEYREGRAG